MRALLLMLLLGAPSLGLAAGDDGDIVEELANAQLPDPPMEGPPEEATAVARTERLQKALRCPVCQGLSVSDSPADAARAMGNRIEELVRQGYTEDQITEYFVDRYGAWVELEPPQEDHQALFIVPFVGLGLGLVGLVVWARRREDGQPVVRPAYRPDPALAPYRERILSELGEEVS